jgi:methylenetetrahydrofolate reductase (NADPH)
MESSKVDIALEGCKLAGISNILALRGDPPAGQEAWTAVEGGFTCALDLVRYIKSKYDDTFCISVAGYPEGHPTKMSEVADESELSETERRRCSIDIDDATGKKTILVCRDADFEGELEYLKQKVQAGASAIITQMFFDTEVYGTFVDACRAKGINVPIVPGIMCISNYGGFKRMIKFCKTRVPQNVLDEIESIKDSEEAVKQFGVTFGVAMCRRLIELGAPGLHFYTLNSSVVTTKILDALDMGHAVKA